MNCNELFVNQGKLPHPLKQEEIVKLFEEIERGNSKARDTIVLHNVRLIIHEAKKFRNSPYEMKELVAIGALGLTKAINTYRLENKTSFSTYAAKCINNEILLFFRRERRYFYNNISLEDYLAEDSEGNELNWLDILVDEKANFVADYLEKERDLEIHKCINALPEFERKIAIIYFGFYGNKPMTQKEIADKLQLSQSYVSRLIKKIVKKIGSQLECKNEVEMKEKKDVYNNCSTPSKAKGTGKSFKSIYELLNNYNKEQIDGMLLTLTKEEMELVTLRYGHDLNNPVTSPNWSDQNRKEFYSRLLPKMKKILAGSYKNENNLVKEDKKEEVSCSNNLTKDDYVKILEILKGSLFKKLSSFLVEEQATIVALSLNCFSMEFIADFLGIDDEKTRDVVNNFLFNFESYIDLSGNNIQLTDKQENYIRKLKKEF